MNSENNRVEHPAFSQQNTSPQPLLSEKPNVRGLLKGLDNSHTVRPSNIRQTSIASYITLKSEGELGKKQLIVLKYIAGHPFSSDREISVGLGMPINGVTGRRNELLKFGLIRENGKKHDVQTNREVMVYALP